MSQEQLNEEAMELAEYWSEITGRGVFSGATGTGEVWIDSNRTNGHEYFESIADAENRLKMLYYDLIMDESDEYDPLEGF